MLLRVQNVPLRQRLAPFLAPPIACWYDSEELIYLSHASVSQSEEVEGILQPKFALKSGMNKCGD